LVDQTATIPRLRSDTPRPLVSIIIATKNRAEYLERSLQSIFQAAELYPETELIVIDGASTDGTLELLRRYGSRIAFWISEPDSSIGEAINKGLAKAHGEFIQLFADDDELLPDAIQYMVNYLLAHPEVDAVFGAADNFWESEDGTRTQFQLRVPLGRLSLKRLLRVEMDSWPAPEMQLTRRRLYDSSGGYDTKYRYAGCLDMWCRHAKAGAIFDQIDRVTVRRNYSLESGNVKGSKMLARETTQIIWQYGGAPAVARVVLHRSRVRLTKIWYRILAHSRTLRHPLKSRRGE
jgi:glycosyltransferase involved in cell wall biosynthesis